MKQTILVVFIILLMIAPAQAYRYQGLEDEDIEDTNVFMEKVTNIRAFLEEDTTNQNEWAPWYTNGHYARDLARNASLHNITIGSMILSNNQGFRGRDNYIVNYIIIEDVLVGNDPDLLVVIDPSTDGMALLEKAPFKYFRLYPDGTQVPSYWSANFGYTGIINNRN